MTCVFNVFGDFTWHTSMQRDSVTSRESVFVEGASRHAYSQIAARIPYETYFFLGPGSSP